MINYAAHISAAEVWVFLMSMIGLITFVCVRENKKEKADEIGNRIVARARNRLRHNGNWEL